MWKEVENWSSKSDQEKKLTLEELHKRAYQHRDDFDNYNFDDNKTEDTENEFSIFPDKDQRSR